MDALASLLDGPRARNAFLIRALLDPPWCLRVQSRSPLCVVAMVRGDAWVRHDGGEPVHLDPGDIMVTCGPDPYTVADDLATPPHVIIHPGEKCMTPDGRSLTEELTLGVRSWGTNPDGKVLMLVGSYQMQGEVSRRLLTVLPRLLTVPAGTLDTPLVPLLNAELVKNEPGQEAVLDRLLDLLLIAVLRAWLARPDAGSPGWYTAHTDPVVGPALRMIHNNPAHPWTVASLAAGSGVSRAALARRFTDLVGEPPMKFLTGWRLALAADQLREPDATLGSVARKVGYGSAFALSAAFKREHGVSPQRHREGVELPVLV
ncbi:AraC family transcriptional regulator [Virgisporangium ochraceum]